MQKQGIYQVKNLDNNKCYIGSSLDLDKRLCEHRRLLALGTHNNKHLQAAWDKYGANSFEFSILKEVAIQENAEENNKNLRNIETDYIQEFECYKPEYGYNFIPGGIGTFGLPCSEEKKKKISIANTGRTAHNLGIGMSEEQKQLLREVNSEKYGKSIDVYTQARIFIETLPSIRDVHRKYGTARNTIKDICENRRMPKFLIFRYSGESLETLGLAKIERSEVDLQKSREQYRNNKGKAVDVYDITGNFINTFPAIVAVHEYFGISESTVRVGLKTGKLAAKMFFRYSGEELGDIKDLAINYNPKSAQNSILWYNIYIKDTFMQSMKYKKDVETLAKPREKSKLQKLLTACSQCGDMVNYHEYTIKLDIAHSTSDSTTELRQLNMRIEGTENNCANGEA